MRLQGKVAIVTGGAHGIGKAYVLGLAKEGAKVVVADIDYKAAQSLVREVSNMGTEALAIQVDVSSPESTKEMARHTGERFGRIDILINNAAMIGVVPLSNLGFQETTVEEWDLAMAVNLRGPWLCTRAVFPYMKDQGRGKIINISSTTFFGKAPGLGNVHYIASKGGIIALTRALAVELSPYGITVNCVAPGLTLSTDPESPRYEEMLRQAEKRIPDRLIKRVETPEDLVGTIVFLSTQDSDFITGQTIVVDGGQVMH